MKRLLLIAALTLTGCTNLAPELARVRNLTDAQLTAEIAKAQYAAGKEGTK